MKLALRFRRTPPSVTRGSLAHTECSLGEDVAETWRSGSRLVVQHCRVRRRGPLAVVRRCHWFALVRNGSSDAEDCHQDGNRRIAGR
jgi:hypothetical protein